MATYIMFGNYSGDARRSITAQRTQETMNLVKRHGGEIKEIYSLLGSQYDILIVADLPGSQEALKCSLALGKLTGISFSTATAFQVQEFDRLAKEALS